MSKLDDFIKERELLNEKTLNFGQKNIKRFFNLDWNTYKEGHLNKKTKEMLGLSASMVLRCDDCITYHLIECFHAGVTDEEVEEIFSVALIVGGSIVIPHLRRAVARWEEIKEKYNDKPSPNAFDYDSLSIQENKLEYFHLLLENCKSILSEEENLNTAMQKICELLDHFVPYYNWTGFYLADAQSRMLHLGAYVGEATEHTKIAYGKGICGQAAESNKTFLVPDVSLAGNYLACSIKTKSEIVIPIFNKNAEFVGELDIDSHEIDPFDDIDKTVLEQICEVLGTKF
jgi:L-methionine (R)-S-oxide reductase